MFQKLNKYFFAGLFLAFMVTFFSRNNIRSVTRVTPEVIKQPLQGTIYNQNIIQFVKDGYEYNLTPVYDYEISGLLVGKMDYRFFSIDRLDSMFPFDVCLIWGSNVANGVYRDRRVKFSQDCRWCWAYWIGDVHFNLDELSNNHLVVDDDNILKLLKYIVRGDQIRIKGKLVNVKAKLLKKTGQPDMVWNTSTSRTDSGAGACEVIYVEEIEVLKEANVLSRILFKVSSYGLLFLVAWKFISFLRTLRV
jgi:hypothetical protein